MQLTIRTFACALLLGCLHTAAQAQEANYWTHAIGTRGALLGGAMVGGARDNSAIFYNPAALAFITNPSLSISANAYQFNQLRLKNGAGTGEDVQSNQIQLLPLLIGGVRRFARLPRLTLAYGLLSRAQSSTSASAREDAIKKVFTEPADSLQEYIGFMQLRSLHRELWGGVSVGYQFGKSMGERFSIGLSSFVAVRLVNTVFDQSAQALPSTVNRGPFTYVATASSREAVDLTHFRLIFKLGLAYEVEGWKLGLTATAPSIGLGGSAVVSRENLLSNLYRSVPVALRPTYADLLATDRQDGISANWRTPLSIALGVERSFGKTTVAVSAEWFDKVKTYDVTEPEVRSFLRPSTVVYPVNNVDFLRVKQTNKSVFNWAIGIEQQLTSLLSLTASYRSDYSYFERAGRQPSGLGSTVGATTNLNISRIGLDLHHLTLGATLRRERQDISLGFSWGLGRKGDISQLVNFANPRDVSLLFDQRSPSSASFDSFGLIVGFTQRIK